MKIINSGIEIMRTGLEETIMTPEQFIEKVGRTCYKSEDKITDTSASKFVTNLIKRGHEAMIEHYNLIFKMDRSWYYEIENDWFNLMSNGNIELSERLRPFLRFTYQKLNGEDRYIISGNMRTWRDYVGACLEGFNFIPMYLYELIKQYPIFFPEFQEFVPSIIQKDILTQIGVRDLVGRIEKETHWDITVKFICDRGVTHEIVRHRTSSFAQESTRYCNYSGDKFGNEITVVKPTSINMSNLNMYDIWLGSCTAAETDYFDLLKSGATPQEARSVLPTSTKAELIMTTNIRNWSHFFDLRCAADAHPDMQVSANMVRDAFCKIDELCEIIC